MAGAELCEAVQQMSISGSNLLFGIACFSILSARVSTGHLSTLMSEGRLTVMVPEVLADGAWSLATAARRDTPGVAGAGILSTREGADDVGSGGAKNWVN